MLRTPEMAEEKFNEFDQILSINVFEELVILVGIIMWGTKRFAVKISRNVAVEFTSFLIRSMLKSPTRKCSLFSDFNFFHACVKKCVVKIIWVHKRVSIDATNYDIFLPGLIISTNTDYCSFVLYTMELKSLGGLQLCDLDI